MLRKNPDGSYIVEGIMQLGDLAKGLELDNDYFEEAKGDAETLGGLVVELFGRIPKVREISLWMMCPPMTMNNTFQKRLHNGPI